MDRWILRGIKTTFKGTVLTLCVAREPFKPHKTTTPFLVYFTSRQRGICVGMLVARTVVLSAAICVTNPTSRAPDTRPVTIVTGTYYRHPRRGIRVPITSLIIPKMPEELAHRAYLLQKSPVAMMMKRRVPDILAETPLRALDIDWRGEDTLTLQQDCLTAGWHFFYKNDKVYPVHKFLLQRYLRVQFINIVKMHEWCDVITMKMAKSLTDLGFNGKVDSNTMLCLKDPDGTAQPCHGMYGAPLLCDGRAVGMMMAPDAQWINCTGFSNIYHLFSSDHLRDFMQCISRMFQSDGNINWAEMKNAMYQEEVEYDYIPTMYDRLVADADSKSSDEE